MADVIMGWQCIGCGRIEAPQPCIGVCQDRRVDLVNADAYHNLQSELEKLERRTRRLEAVVRQMALSTPRDDAWEQSFKALKSRARAALTP